MTQDEIIEMARQAWISNKEAQLITEFKEAYISCTYLTDLEAFAKLVAEKERAKSLKLWMLLDDVDTADDIAKADDAIYRSLCRQAHKKRWDVLTGDDVDNAIRARGQA